MTKLKQILSTLFFCILLSHPTLSAQAAPRVQDMGDSLVIVIDPGHGGENLGTIENGFLEKEMTLKTAQAMYEELCLYDNIQVYMTRTEDIDLSLKERAEYAASVDADFLFSLHYNASLNHTLYGSEIWIPAASPYNAYGYQFGYMFLKEMQEMGMHLRGIKTRLNDDKLDYYGVIRESAALSVPAVILEHCHVDELHDSVMCNSDDDLEAFGRADATAVAKYFNLKSTALGVDYSQENPLPQAEEKQVVKSTIWDDTPPDVCVIDMVKKDYIDHGENMNVTISVSAADYDSPLIFFDYSMDGGNTYSPLQVWPESDVLKGSYKDTFELSLVIPAGQTADIVVRAYNLFDAFSESNQLQLLLPTAPKEQSNAVWEENISHTAADKVKDNKTKPGTTTFMPAISTETDGENDELSFISFLKLCLIIVILLFIMVLVSQALSYRRRKKRRRQRRNDFGNNRSHPR